MSDDIEKKRDALWKAYDKNPTQEIRDELILEYAPLVKYVAGRLSMHMGQYVDFDDLVGYGIFGLFDAIEKFDYKKGVKFETYANLRIRGAIIDSIRRMDWVPRTLRQKNKQYERAYQKLASFYGREPTEEELAKEMNMSLEETKELIEEASIASLISLDDHLDQNYETQLPFEQNHLETPEEAFTDEVVRETLIKAIDELNENERKVITLYYFEDLTLREISEIIGVTESRISQIHTKSVAKLKEKLGDHRSILF